MKRIAGAGSRQDFLKVICLHLVCAVIQATPLGAAALYQHLYYQALRPVHTTKEEASLISILFGHGQQHAAQASSRERRERASAASCALRAAHIDSRGPSVGRADHHLATLPSAAVVE